jgi:chromosome segregation protein
MDGVRIVSESGQGRASFLPMSHARTNADGHALPAGILGRLSDFVETEESHRGAVECLLGQALLVEDLARAVAVRAAESNGWTLVTLAGEVMEPSGVITGGKGISGGGIIRRAAERRTLETERAGLAAQIASLEERLVRSRVSEAALETEIERLASLAESEKSTRAVKTAAIERLKEKQSMLSNEQGILESERHAFEREAAQFDSRAAELRAAIDAVKREDAELENRIEALTASHSETAKKRMTLSERMTDLKVTLARTRQQEEGRRTAIETLTANLRVREDEVSGLGTSIEDAKRKQEEARAEIAKCEGDLVELQSKEADQQKRVLEISDSRETLRDEAATLDNTAREIKKRLSDLDVDLGEQRLLAQEVKLKMENLAARVRDDYQLDLVEMHRTWTPESMNWEEVALRIEELKLKVANMGNVNMEAIDSEEALSARAEFLQGQRSDLNEAKRQLAEIIEKLNKESLELFQKSFAVVRDHFQEMFRKLFGGGKADIFLEDEQNVLESGIEIIARPPGKEPRSISLLSGGEKVMTAVALLFAIFKSRPSPFCVLDEVDAALDEANIGRFTSIVQDFLVHSQFIIVTHSKRTMAVANVIYGITMQESGVSKRISVKFEDYEQQVA